MRMYDPLLSICHWQEVDNMAAAFCTAHGLGIVFWPSGKRTIEHYSGTAMMSRVEAARAYSADTLRGQYEENLSNNLKELRERVHTTGWFVRTTKRGRHKARRVQAVAWLHPDSYTDPVYQYYF